MKRLLAIALLWLALLPWLCAAETIISPADAKQYAGKKVTVRGTVAEVHVSAKGDVFLNFDAPYPQQTFAVVIYHNNRAAFGDLTRYQGKTVSATGTITVYRKRPDMKVATADQLTQPSS